MPSSTEHRRTDEAQRRSRRHVQPSSSSRGRRRGHRQLSSSTRVATENRRSADDHNDDAQGDNRVVLEPEWVEYAGVLYYLDRHGQYHAFEGPGSDGGGDNTQEAIGLLSSNATRPSNPRIPNGIHTVSEEDSFEVVSIIPNQGSAYQGSDDSAGERIQHNGYWYPDVRREFLHDPGPWSTVAAASQGGDVVTQGHMEQDIAHVGYNQDTEGHSIYPRSVSVDDDENNT